MPLIDFSKKQTPSIPSIATPALPAFPLAEPMSAANARKNLETPDQASQVQVEGRQNLLGSQLVREDGADKAQRAGENAEPELSGVIDVANRTLSSDVLDPNRPSTSWPAKEWSEMTLSEALTSAFAGDLSLPTLDAFAVPQAGNLPSWIESNRSDQPAQRHTGSGARRLPAQPRPSATATISTVSADRNVANRQSASQSGASSASQQVASVGPTASTTTSAPAGTLQPLFRCSLCGFSCATEGEGRAHFHAVHGLEHRGLCPLPRQTDQYHEGRRSYYYECIECGLSLETFAKCEYHFTKEHDREMLDYRRFWFEKAWLML